MKKLFYTLIASSLLLASCDSNPTLPTATGTANEVLMVINEDVFRSNVGDSIIQILNHDVPCMPQSEPMFNISRTNFEGCQCESPNVLVPWPSCLLRGSVDGV